MKNLSISILLTIILFLLTGCNNSNTNNLTNYNATRTNIPENTSASNENAINQKVTVILNNNITTSNTIENADNNSNSETELSSFSTEILTSDPNRNNNIQLTCDKLNEHIIEAGEIFSFTKLIGKSTEDKGYKEANIIEADGDTIKGLGGGNCQVSSTLYNAVAKIPELEIIERHNHAAEVHYVPLGQDAAVAYGSVDFKFKNTLDSKIKIYADSDDKNITVKITSIK